MAREIKYYVIGGQYSYYNYGGAYTLEGAKRLATKHQEYWDNWYGWHKPAIYKAKDCEIGTNFYGTNYYPNKMAIAHMTWNQYYNKWELLK